ncbi:MAG: hypothetical protein HYR68_04475, partial [Burkholderiales bacterium]|nr:hypothetical protein [Burkholderiales bacterium]
APSPTDGSFIGAALLGAGKNNRPTQQKVSTEAETETTNENKESQ